MHDIGVEKLGKVLGINRTYISNYINDTYQTNFNTWIHKMRIAEAQRLILENPQTSLGQIASMTGYTDQAHFCKQFRVVTGISPTKWKKENAEK
ncbi:AraC family transcriptional regulator [Bacteroides sp. ET336]|uniref:helix-turn-helix domain-containing protein n=1 Tax=Bacteroides sp. ET336 TaxID=2972459 RepID=UPI0021ABC900|nr:AraC family transcriptional regulator [Bacteroides sp. ET336]MCR8894361.1 AraC family transcriptional regulator [Bacteroides sp. ET336]MDN0058857.1 AraC family transcriptional regulator [Bacteroides caecigallinarum]